MDEATWSAVRARVADRARQNARRIEEYRAVGGADTSYLDGKAQAFAEALEALDEVRRAPPAPRRPPGW